MVPSALDAADPNQLHFAHNVVKTYPFVGNIESFYSQPRSKKAASATHPFRDNQKDKLRDELFGSLHEILEGTLPIANIGESDENVDAVIGDSASSDVLIKKYFEVKDNLEKMIDDDEEYEDSLTDLVSTKEKKWMMNLLKNSPLN